MNLELHNKLLHIAKEVSLIRQEYPVQSVQEELSQRLDSIAHEAGQVPNQSPVPYRKSS